MPSLSASWPSGTPEFLIRLHVIREERLALHRFQESLPSSLGIRYLESILTKANIFYALAREKPGSRGVIQRGWFSHTGFG
jgi:hypothetical protein